MKRARKTQKDEKLAFRYYLRAAKGGRAEAMMAVACRLYNGQGVEKDLPHAFDWFVAAADYGMERANFNIAYCYFAGNGVEKNEALAHEYAEKIPDEETRDHLLQIMRQLSEEERSKDNYFQLAVSARDEKKYDLTLTLLQRVIAEGGPNAGDAAAIQGEMLEAGEGCKKDAQKALEAYKAGAARHSERALLDLMQYYCIHGPELDKAQTYAERLPKGQKRDAALQLIRELREDDDEPTLRVYPYQKEQYIRLDQVHEYPSGVRLTSQIVGDGDHEGRQYAIIAPVNGRERLLDVVEIVEKKGQHVMERAEKAVFEVMRQMYQERAARK